MNVMLLLQFVVGLALLIVGAELLVRQAARLAQDAGIAPVVVGLTVVAFGTSAPELAISIKSALSGAPDLALGNVVGSNIANILLILGISALITPMLVAQQLIRYDVPIMIGASLLVYWMARSGQIGPLEGALLAGLLVAFVGFEIWYARRSPPEIKAEYSEGYAQTGSEVRGRTWVRILVLMAGVLIMVFGANWLVESASAMARALGVSELVIGLTIVAIGTSAPELATSIVAALRGQRDIAVGNVVGSNIFNLLFVLGTTAVISRTGIAVAPQALAFDIPFMCAVAIACLPVFWVGSSVSRWEGALFVTYYAAYTLLLYFSASDAARAVTFGGWLAAYAIPLTVLGLVLSVLAEMRRRRKRAKALASELPPPSTLSA